MRSLAMECHDTLRRSEFEMLCIMAALGLRRRQPWRAINRAADQLVTLQVITVHQGRNGLASYSS